MSSSTQAPSLNGRESSHPYEPVAVEALFHQPKGHIDPDSSKGWIKRMMPVIMAHKRVIATGLGAALVMVFIQVAIPKVVKDAIDTGLPSPTHPERDLQPLGPFALILLVLAVARFGVSFVYRYNLLKTAQLMEYDLRSNMFDHFNRLSFSFFDSVQTGQLISRANSDIRAVERFLTFAPMMAITGIQFFAALFLMMRMHVTLALVSLAPLPFVYLTGRYMRTRMFPISWVVQARMADLATIVEENVTGVRIVKSFAAEKQQIGVASKATLKLRWAAIKQIDLRAKFAPLMENLPRVGLLLILFYGGWLALKKPPEVEVGTLVAFSAYVVTLQAPFRILGFLMIMSQRAAASAQRIFEIFDQQPAITDSPKAVDLTEPRGEVEFRNVTFAYGTGADVLKNFNLHLAPGETVAMVGRTGCGKSTVARLIPRFYDVKDGVVLVDGRDVRDITVRSLRANVGMVLDEPFLFSEAIRDNIAFGRPDAEMETIIQAARPAGAHDFIEELPEGYDTVIGERGYTLSGGQRQRTAIARTLLTNPRVLILDDATSSVDVQIEQEIHDALRALMKGRTTLIIAHRLSTISLADRVLLVDDGRVVADGTHTELMRTVPLYSEVLARAEEEWIAAHTQPTEEELEKNLPSRLRALKRLAEARESQAKGGPPDFDLPMDGSGPPGRGGF